MAMAIYGGCILVSIEKGSDGEGSATKQTMKLRSIPAGKFKDSCLKLMEEVHKHGIPLTVTKRGKPLVQVVPVREEGLSKGLLGTIIYEADDILSTGETWEADN